MCEKVEIRYEWTCPHCGHRNANYATVRDRYGSLSPALVYCDIEDGGCDRLVAVRPRLCVRTEVFALAPAAEASAQGRLSSRADDSQGYWEWTP